MKLLTSLIPALLVASTFAPGGALAQEERTISPEETNRLFLDWLESVTVFTRDARFGDDDVTSYLEHWDAFLELSKEVEQEMVADWLEGGLFDYGRFLRLPRYLEWAKGRGLDPDVWLRRSTRILLMAMRQEAAETLRAADEQMPLQRQAVEQMREQLGEEGYAQALVQLDAAAELIEQTRAAYRRMPPPTAEEQAVLDRQRDRLQAYVESD